MTREEAIKILNPATSFDALLGMDREEGIKVVEEACLLAVADIEKQIPKKPKEYEDRYYACECGNILLPKWKKYNTELMPKSEGLPYCLNCGQALDWTEEGE